MFFYLDRNDRTGSILLLILYIYAYCFKYNIIYDGVIGNNNWWCNDIFFNKIKTYFNINNKKESINNLRKIEFNDLEKYSNKITDNLYFIFDVKTLCPYFSKNIDMFFDDKFKIFMNNNIKLNKNFIMNNNNIIISIHIRRGDVDKNIPIRYTDDNVYINLINNIIKKNNLKNYEIHIFSEKQFNGNLSLYNKLDNIFFHLEKSEYILDLNNVFNDLLFMINSDYLICSKSGFSYVPALLNNKNNIYHNNKFWCSPKKKFILYDDNTGQIIFSE